MFPEEPIPFRPFDLSDRVGKYHTNLPHWRQNGATYFVTFRLRDSIPRQVLERWEREKREWLSERSVTLPSVRKKIQPRDVPESHRLEFSRVFERKLNEHLDLGLGECLFADKENREILYERMEKASGMIGDFVIMPNHCHALLTPEDGQSLEAMLKRIKGGSSRYVNKRLGRSGSIWQKDSFDHIVRSMAALEKYQFYIKENPSMANLSTDDFQWNSSIYSAY